MSHHHHHHRRRPPPPYVPQDNNRTTDSSRRRHSPSDTDPIAATTPYHHHHHHHHPHRSKYRREILYCIEQYSLLVLVGNSSNNHPNINHNNTTISTAATYIPTDLYECGYCRNHQILITSPNSKDTIACAERTMDLLQPQQQQQHEATKPIVGYTTELQDSQKDLSLTKDPVNIRYVTHDVVLHEIATIDPLLMRYSIILVHQIQADRTVSTDVVLGLLHKIRQHRNHTNNKLRLVLLVHTNNDNDHSLATMLLQYFLGNERALQIIHRSTTSLSTPTTTTATVEEPSNVVDHANDANRNHTHDGMILSIYEHSLCPVNMYYLSQPTSDYIVSMIETIWYILQGHSPNSTTTTTNTNHNSMHPTTTGDILCFVPSYYDMTTAIPMAEEYFDQQYRTMNTTTNAVQNMQHDYNVDFLPFSTSLPYHVQEEILQPPPCHPKWTSSRKRRQLPERRRRVIFTNLNVERTSITILPNIQYVIDSGYMEVSSYFDANIGLYRNGGRVPISQQHAQQRASYASSTTMTPTSDHKTTSSTFVVGQCYRLYTEIYMTEQMIPSSIPEMARTDVTNVILLLKSIGIDNIFTFDFITLPNMESIRYGLETLYMLGAMDDTTAMTPLGYDMAQLSVEPRMARMLLESIQYNCTWEVITIASVIHIQQLSDYDSRPYHLLQTKPKHQQHQQMIDYEEMMSNVADITGDHVSYWNIFTDIDQQYSGSVDSEYCSEHFLQYNTVRQCLNIRKHLARALKRVRATTTIGVFHHGGDDGPDEKKRLILDRSQAIRRCVTTGYMMNIAKLHNDGQYYTIQNDGVLVVPSKYSLYTTHSKMSSEYIVFCQSGSGSGHGSDGNDQIEINHISSIEAKWLRDIAPFYFE